MDLLEEYLSSVTFEKDIDGILEMDTIIKGKEFSSKYPHIGIIYDIVVDGKPHSIPALRLPFPFNVVNDLLLKDECRPSPPQQSNFSTFFENEYTQAPCLYDGSILRLHSLLEGSPSNQYHNTMLYTQLSLEDEHSISSINCWGNKQQFIEEIILPNYLLRKRNYKERCPLPPPPLPTDIFCSDGTDTIRIGHSMLPSLKKKQSNLFHLASGLHCCKCVFPMEKDINSSTCDGMMLNGYHISGTIFKNYIFDRKPISLTNDQLIDLLSNDSNYDVGVDVDDNSSSSMMMMVVSSTILYSLSLRIAFDKMVPLPSSSIMETLSTFALIQCNLAIPLMELAPLALGILSLSGYLTISPQTIASSLRRIILSPFTSSIKVSAVKGFAFSQLATNTRIANNFLMDESHEGLLYLCMVNEEYSSLSAEGKRRSFEEEILISLIMESKNPVLKFIKNSFKIFSTLQDIGDWKVGYELLNQLKGASSSSSMTKTFDTKIKEYENDCLRWLVLLGMAIILHINPSLTELELVLMKEIGQITRCSTNSPSPHIRSLIMTLLSSRPNGNLPERIRWAILISSIFPFKQNSSPKCCTAIMRVINWSMFMIDFVVIFPERIENNNKLRVIETSPLIKAHLFDHIKGEKNYSWELFNYLIM